MSEYGEGCADFYDELYGPPKSTVVKALSRLAAGGHVLELGIGTGRTSLALRGHCASVAGIESSKKMLAQLLSKPGVEGMRIIEGDFSSVRLEDRFDLIFSLVNTLFLVSRQDQVGCLKNVRDMLADGGVFVLETYEPADDESSDKDGCVNYERTIMTSKGNRNYQVRLCYREVEDLDAAARDAGLVLRERWSNWRGAPHTPDSKIHVSVYGVRPDQGKNK